MGDLQNKAALRSAGTALCLVFASAALVGCLGPTEDPSDSIGSNEAAQVPGVGHSAKSKNIVSPTNLLGDSQASGDCVTVKRGLFGTVADANITQGDPDANHGADQASYAGVYSRGHSGLLIRFELGFIPQNATVLSASVSMYTKAAVQTSLLVHDVYAPWDESTVTWNSFASAYNPSIDVQVPTGAADAAVPVSFSVLSLAQSWVSDPSANSGLFIDQATYKTRMWTSEHLFLADRPELTVCYSVPAADGTKTQGYWKTHPSAWPVDTIVIGGITYTKDEAIALMKAPTAKDVTFSMVQQLIAAKLNVMIGNESSCIDQTIADADAWMALHPAGSDVSGGSSDWAVGDPLMIELDDYNNGLLCAPHDD